MLQAADVPAKAPAYLDDAAGLVDAAPPEFQAGAPLQSVSVVASYDPKRSLELYERALPARVILPTQTGDRAREEFQAKINVKVATLDLNRAVEILRMIPPRPRAKPIQN